MSTIFVTATGFQKKTLAEITVEQENILKGIFGNDIDLDASGPFGQLVGLYSKREADLWDGAEEIYTARNPNEATGISLDNIVSENGIQRLPATPTTVTDIILSGDEGTTVAAGKRAKNTTQTVEYILDEEIEITALTAREGIVSVTSVVVSNDYTVTIDAVPYTYEAQGGDDENAILNGIKTEIDGGAWGGTATVDTTAETLTIQDVDTDFSFSITGDLIIDSIGSAGNFTADTTGSNTLPANSLTEIVTPVSGWDSVNNPSAGVTGRDIESDEALRIRREQSIVSGNATEIAIRERILNDVAGVTGIIVRSNRKGRGQTQTTDFDTEFVTGNNIDFTINGTIVTTVPFNADQDTTMSDIKTQIEADVSNTTVKIDTSLKLIITKTDIGFIDVTVIISGGASQPVASIYDSDIEGRYTHSVESVVSGGDDNDIAEKIWEVIGGGIDSYGNTLITVTDSQGFAQPIRFSRAVNKYAWVRVSRDFYDEETYPANGDSLIKQAIVDWSLIVNNINIGKDLIRQRLSIPIYTVSGIDGILIEIAITDDPGDTPSYLTADIPIGFREIAVFSTTRITVQDIP